MRIEKTPRDRITGTLSCLCVCGFLAVTVSLLFGQDVSTPIGRAVIYSSFALQVVNLLVIRLQERALRKKASSAPSQKMRKFHRIFAWCWRIGAALLTAALVFLVAGHGAQKLWVWLPCLIGSILTPIGWLGAMLSYYRRRQSALYQQARKS